MTTSFKSLTLHVMKALGLFRLARIATGGRLRILCYHGLSLHDEHLFQPRLFMRPELLRRRLKALRDQGFPILSLDEALDALERGTLPRGAVVLTFDDGFVSNLDPGVAILREFDAPATIYVTTYYAVDTRPVFRLVVRYLFWKTTCPTLDLGALELGEDWGGTVDLANPVTRDRTLWRLIRHGESSLAEDGRERLARTLAERLGLSYDDLLESRALSLMTTDEIRAAAEAGVSIQLHTHRHRFPAEERSARREIVENRAALEAVPGVSARHFCYPSGEWTGEQWPWLEAERVQSAVTCDPGLNDSRTPRYGLRRFLDADGTPQIEFEAEIHGLLDILRRLFRRR